MNQEKRYLLAAALSFLVLILFYTPLFSRKAQNAVPPQEESFLEPQSPSQTPESTENTLGRSQLETGTPAQFYDLENAAFAIQFTNKGAAVSELTLKNNGNAEEELVRLVSAAKGTPAFAVTVPNEPTSLAQADFKLEHLDLDQKTISFIYENETGLSVRKRYELARDKPTFKIILEFENNSDRSRQIPLEFVSRLDVGGEHSNYDQDQWESFMVLKIGKIKVVKAGKMKKTPITISEAVEWQALTRKYFAVIVRPDQEASSVESRFTNDKDGILEATLRFPPQEIASKTKLERSFLVYAGPEYYEALKPFGFEATLTQGLWGLFRYWLFLSLRFCEKLTGSYGFAILLLTLLVKVLFSPFTHMSFDSMRKMQTIQPKLKAIQAQFKNDPTRLNKEMMELYRRYKVNPMGGCLPMLIQIPIFIGFYQVLAQFVELKGEAFWWFKDLTLPDRLAKIPYVGFDFNLLPLLMIGTMIWQQKVTPQQSMGSPEQAKMMQFMPIVFGFFFYQLPSGLVLYWTVNNLLTVMHQMLFHHKSKPISED